MVLAHLERLVERVAGLEHRHMQQGSLMHHSFLAGKVLAGNQHVAQAWSAFNPDRHRLYWDGDVCKDDVWASEL